MLRLWQAGGRAVAAVRWASADRTAKRASQICAVQPLPPPPPVGIPSPRHSFAKSLVPEFRTGLVVRPVKCPIARRAGQRRSVRGIPRGFSEASSIHGFRDGHRSIFYGGCVQRRPSLTAGARGG
ncbi:unnamed protein product [Lampetra fluviatilis]